MLPTFLLSVAAGALLAVALRALSARLRDAAGTRRRALPAGEPARCIRPLQLGGR